MANPFNIKRENLKKNSFIKYTPTSKEELINIIVKEIKSGNKDLNCIDTSKITDMSELFFSVKERVSVDNIDISCWDVSKVKNMSCMFWGCDSMEKLPSWFKEN